MALTAVTKGLRFRYTIADGNPLWEAVRPSGRSAWICVCVNEPFKMSNGQMIDSDYAGTEKAFLNKDILRSVRMAEVWETIGFEGDAWWDAQEIGSTVHYCDGFNVFFRGVVEMGEAPNHPGELRKGIRVTAIVGPLFKECDTDANGEIIPNTFVQGIRPFDLPRIDSTGAVNMGRYADRIGDFWTPSHTCMYENPASSYRTRGVDPRPLAPIDLSPPTPSVDQEKLNALVWQSRNLAVFLNDVPEGATWQTMQDRLNMAVASISIALDSVSEGV